MTVRVRARKFFGSRLRSRLGSYTSRRPRIGRAFIGGPVAAVLEGMAVVAARGGDPLPSRRAPLSKFYRNGVVHPMSSRCYGSYFTRLGWGLPPVTATDNKVYVKVAKRVWRWVRKDSMACPCAWCRLSWKREEEVGWKALERRRMAELEGHLLAMAEHAIGMLEHVWVGCAFGRERRLYVSELLKEFLDAAQTYLEGQKHNVVRATVTYAAKRMADPRCSRLRRLLASGQGHAACEWVHDAARRHPGAGALVFPGMETFRRRLP